ncbi:MAG: MFS transporter [Nanoarchaeota archaeon]|nr:MFS transporter [Nanoarchaeota archaeon]
MKFFNIDSLRKNLSELHIHLTIENIALSLISVFIPIFMLTIGFSLNDIYFYYLVYSFSTLLSSLFSFVFSRIGFKKIIMLRPVSVITFLLWLYSLEFFPSSYFFLAVYNGFFSGIYWVIFHFFFAKKADGDDVEGQVGLLFAMPKLFTMISPMIGALIISFFSFNVLFLLVAFLLLVSILPLIHLKEQRFSFKFEVSNLLDWSFVKYALGFINESIHYYAVVFLLPLYIYFTLSSTLEIGFFSTVVGVSGFLTPLIISSLCRGRTNLFIKLGAMLNAVFFFFVFFLKTPLEFFLFGFIIGTFTSFWEIPFYSRMYKHARNSNTLEFFIFRKVIHGITESAIFVLLLLTSNFSIIFLSEITSKILFVFF